MASADHTEGGGGSRSVARMGADLAWDREVSTGTRDGCPPFRSSPGGIQAGLPGSTQSTAKEFAVLSKYEAGPRFLRAYTFLTQGRSKVPP
ncbi:hypothetical protein SGFS_082820 [Streptomyces graminofaciens]|uniref:Uncharacterized protein n=1 Tax=Streptomyces graminofaciens TaxID=68212 RepID=A0ABN5VWT4_9ACTN|nr:hypothetical protein SGFS_082820 [Streptomyces graminofaciens]